MKEWFKYEFGYVNIDSENLFLTNTGNWSETKELVEKTAKGNSKGDKSNSAIVFLALIGCVFGFMIFKGMMNQKLGIGLIVALVGIGYKVYNYMKTDIGSTFKIPLNKITAINFIDGKTEILFQNGDNNPDRYVLQNIDENAIRLLGTLNPAAV